MTYTCVSLSLHIDNISQCNIYAILIHKLALSRFCNGRHVFRYLFFYDTHFVKYSFFTILIFYNTQFHDTYLLRYFFFSILIFYDTVFCLQYWVFTILIIYDIDVLRHSFFQCRWGVTPLTRSSEDNEYINIGLFFLLLRILGTPKQGAVLMIISCMEISTKEGQR